MDFISTLLDKIKLSKEKQIGLFLFSLIIVIFAQYETLLQIMKIDFIKPLLPFFSILCLLLFSLIISKPIYDIATYIYHSFFYQKNTKEYLQKLTSDEKDILKYFIENNVRTQYLDYSNGTANGLQAKKIIFCSSNIGIYGTTISYNIQDVAFDILKKHPEYLL